MPPFVDIHTHVPYHTTGTGGREQDDVISILSLRAGVDSPDILTLHNGPFSVGVHPWDAEVDDNPLIALKPILAAGPVAVGETGLDFLHNPTSRNLQCKLFRLQLQLAIQLRLPVIIHSVRTLSDVLKILKDYPSLTAVFHGFIGNSIQTADIIARGHYISLAPTALRSPKTLEALHKIPLERLFLETDNSHTNIRSLYIAVANHLGIQVDALKQQLFFNYSKIFLPHDFSKLDSTDRTPHRLR